MEDSQTICQTTAQQVAPLLADPSVSNLQESLRLLSMQRSRFLQQEFIARYGLQIQAGLFAGMEYLPDCAEGCYLPKLLGCYEAELAPYFQAASHRPYEVLLNIGCSEGFYAVGLARLMPKLQVFAHDTNELAHADCRQLAEINGVSDRITIGGTFSPQDFQNYEERRTLVLCDIEGGEEALLDPALAPALAGMDLIVELHDGFAPGIQATLEQRFAATHQIEVVEHQLRAIELPPLLSELGSMDQLLAISEWRAFPTPWLVMRSLKFI
jgi:hypothetical protein